MGTRVAAFARRGGVLLASLAAALAAAAASPAAPETQASTTAPIDPSQQTAIEFGLRSHWLQPWRAYSETVSATTLQAAVGINFNVSAEEAPATARLLASEGFKRARVEVSWGSLAYDDPSRLRNGAELEAKLAALRDNGIRPLILVNSHHGVPCPTRFFSAYVTASAQRGDRTLQLDSATAAQVVPGRTGLNALDGRYKAADILFTALHGGAATLSKPLPRDLGPGTYPAATLRYAPFEPPQLAGGEANPAFEQTMSGWLDYLEVVTGETKQVLGSDAFDVEIWNEFSFGSDFLDAGNYYEPFEVSGQGDVADTILRRSVSWLRDPSHGVDGIGIGDGFSNQRPWDAGSTSPVGLTALDKHPYSGMKRFPQDAVAGGIRPVNALGQPEGWRDAQGRWHDSFIPTYDSFFPEYFLSAIQTETMVRDLSPWTTTVYGTEHGRLTHPVGGEPLQTWITELNMDPAGADPHDPGDVDGPALAHLGAADITHLQAKSALRSLAAYVNKGASMVDFYAAKDGNFSLIDPAFFEAIDEKPNADPGEAAAGESPAAIGRFLAGFDGAAPISAPRDVSLLAVEDPGDHRQFSGDGTAAHPPLYDRDVLAFLPFQVDPRRFVIPTYVMTRNVARLYRPDAPESDLTRYDLPDETFRLVIGGVDAPTATVTATDPLAGTSVPVSVLSRSAGRLTVELPLTDSPRLLTVEDQPGLDLTASEGESRPADASRLPAGLNLVRARIRNGRLSLLATVNQQASRPVQLSVRYRAGGRERVIDRSTRPREGRLSSRIRLPVSPRDAGAGPATIELRFPGDSQVQPGLVRRRIS